MVDFHGEGYFHHDIVLPEDVEDILGYYKNLPKEE